MKKKLSETTWSAYNYPDDGRGVCTDDDRPPGNILIGTKMKQTEFFNKLTTFARNWDYDNGDWTWDDFENAGGMEDYDNYHQTLQAMKPLFSDDKWKNIWKRMRQVPDKETEKEFDKAGQPWRTGATQLGKDKADVALPPKEIQAEELIKRIDKLIL